MGKFNKIILSFLFVSGTILIPNFQQIMADGIFEENLPPATVGDRVASLYTKISPPILTSDTMQNAFFQLRLFDSKTGNNITNVNYFLTITKADKLLLRELFYSKEGPLSLKFEPGAGPIKVFGSTEPFLGGWTSETGQLTVSGPVLSQGGLYHFGIEIFGIDNVRNIFVPENAPRFDSYLSIGDVFTTNLTQNYNTTLISYYDRIQNFTFEPNDLEAKWAMPFDWNVSRIRSQNIFVHEEIKFPKSYSEFSNSTIFSGTVNEQPLVGRSLAIDPFTSENALIIHFLLNKNDILKLAENKAVLGISNDSMKFTIRPQGNQSQETSEDVVTDTGGIHASLIWNPNPPVIGENALGLNFSDALSGNRLNADVNYDLSVKTGTGEKIVGQNNITAINGISNQTLSLPTEGIFNLEVEVKSLKVANQTLPDTTRNGIARGFVVVP
ncbi:MAG TPA: hypothetical protein VJ772_04030 [Nitrososphaeraceae archaeon]|nr:hypothetical protein [Nitrososphaeraceae archaeon]